MEPKANEKNSPQKEQKRVNKTWEAIQKHKGIWTFSNPKWTAIREELLNTYKK